MVVNPTSSAISIAPAATLPAEPSAATPETDEHRRQILENIIELSQPVLPPSVWSRFGSSRFVRRLSCEPTELLSQLGQHFTADQLLAAQVAARTQTGELEVSKVLATKEAFLLRGDVSGRICSDLVSQRGKLSTGTPEWREYTANTTDGNSAPETPIVLCGNDSELYVQVRLGIFCTPLARIDQLNGKEVHALFAQRAKHAHQRRHQMVLLGWQPDALAIEPSAKNLAAIRHVAAIQPAFGFDPHTVFSVWMPSGAELARIRRAHSFGDPAIVAREFKSSLSKSIYSPADALVLLADREPANWPEVRAALESAIERSHVVPRISEAGVALEKLKRAYHDQVLRPLEAAANKTGWEALHSIMGAYLATLWYQELELVQAAHRVVAGQSPGYAKRVDDAVLDRKLRLISTFVKLVREV